LKVAGVLAVTGSGVLRVFRVSAERAAATWERCAGGDDRVWRNAFFDPIYDGSKHVEVIERGTASAVGHAGDEEHATPFGNLLRSAVSWGK